MLPGFHSALWDFLGSKHFRKDILTWFKCGWSKKTVCSSLLLGVTMYRKT